MNALFHPANTAQRSRSARLPRSTFLVALGVSLGGALLWIAAAFGVDGVSALFGSQTAAWRLAYLGVAMAALYAIIAILRTARGP